MKFPILRLLVISVLIVGSSSCKKETEWLDKKYRLLEVVPTTIADFQKLLDADNIMNVNYPGVGINGCDNYFLFSADWRNAVVVPRNCYIWAKDIFEGSSPIDWNNSYTIVEYSNIVLDGLKKIDRNTAPVDYDQVKGSAHFYRAVAFYNLAQVFCKRYSEANKNEPGIPIRLSSDVNIKSERNPIQKVYAQIIDDLKTAEGLLPDFPLVKTRASALGCAGYLSRTYLNMGLYDSCIVYSTKVLNKFNTLINFSTLSTTPTYPFPNIRTGNPEVIFWASNVTAATVRPQGISYVDSALYKSYANDDLRKTLFFRVVSAAENRITFRGTYTGTLNLFGGLAVNEVLINRAESYARTNRLNEALTDINRLLESRFNPNTYIPFASAVEDEVLDYIITERRKELPFTAQLRWEDLRRLNEEPRYQTTLIRIIDGEIYTLLPGDKKYVYPIPDEEIRIFGLEQNER